MISIEDKCREGIHEVVKEISISDAGQSELSVGNCFYCRDNVIITDQYRKVSGRVYELVSQVHHAELDGCRE